MHNAQRPATSAARRMACGACGWAKNHESFATFTLALRPWPDQCQPARQRGRRTPHVASLRAIAACTAGRGVERIELRIEESLKLRREFEDMVLFGIECLCVGHDEAAIRRERCHGIVPASEASAEGRVRRADIEDSSCCHLCESCCHLCEWFGPLRSQ